MSSTSVVQGLIQFFAVYNIQRPSKIIIELLTSQQFLHHPVAKELAAEAPSILQAFFDNGFSTSATQSFAHELVKESLSESVRELAQVHSGWHFSALRATQQKMRDFRVRDMGEKMEQDASQLWDMLEALLLGYVPKKWDPKLADRMEDSDDERDYWSKVDDLGDDPEDNEEMFIGDGLDVTQKIRKRDKQREEQRRTRKIVIISIVLQTINQKCNAMQSVNGIFLHTIRAPERAVKLMSRMGISISQQAIHEAVHHLSTDAQNTLLDLGASRDPETAFDNFDVDFHESEHNVEHKKDTLTHLASGCFLVPHPKVRGLNVRVSDFLFYHSQSNILRNPPVPARNYTIVDLNRIHPYKGHGLTTTEEYNRWKFIFDLVHTCPALQHLEKELKEPDPIDAIPLTKTEYYPARALDANLSGIAGNIKAIPDFLRQVGLGNPTEGLEHGMEWEGITDISPFASLFHCDLGTFEHIQTILDRRGIEETSWDRFQYVVPVMGLFHLKMASADAVWRMFIQPSGAKLDETGFYRLAIKNRPKQAGKLASNPGFRRVHEVIKHVGLLLRLDCWKTEIEKRYGAGTTFDTFAAQKPTIKDLTEIADTLAKSYVAGGELDIYSLRMNPSNQRDGQRENMFLLHQILLLYEQLSYAMNLGDIGRVETLFPSWITIFKGVRKHKYAKYMAKFLGDVHFLYPPNLRDKIRYSILINPSGKEGNWRGVDWLVELMNLYTKDVFGGQGPQYNKARVLEESILIEVYRECHKNIEDNFNIASVTTRHAPPNLWKIYGLLEEHFKKCEHNKTVPGRSTSYQIPEVMDIGFDGLAEEGTVKESEVNATADDIINAE